MGLEVDGLEMDVGGRRRVGRVGVVEGSLDGGRGRGQLWRTVWSADEENMSCVETKEDV